LEIKSASDFIRMTRGMLGAAGFVRQEREGRVWWTGGSDTTSTIVLIHGANDHAGTWFAVAPALAQRHRVIIPDLAGHGESAPFAGPIPISIVLSQLEAIDGDDLTLTGNSFGGWMALLFALRNPRRVRNLVLENSGGLSRPLGVPLVARTREEALPILRAVHGPRYEPPEWVIDALVQRSTDSPMLRLTEAAEHEVETRLEEIRVPTTLIWGADDGVLPLAYAEDLQRAIPGATLRLIEGAAHVPHMQQPARFLECLNTIF
jgi:pimeloyl-ACP methyl ester carboxylesterase